MTDRPSEVEDPDPDDDEERPIRLLYWFSVFQVHLLSSDAGPPGRGYTWLRDIDLFGGLTTTINRIKFHLTLNYPWLFMSNPV